VERQGHDAQQAGADALPEGAEKEEHDAEASP
jgi:hypothetical protein